MLLFFQNSYAIFAHILQHYHDFQSNIAIFPSVVKAYTQPYSLSGRIKLIICQIKHKLSVTIHEISTILKRKTLDGGPYVAIILKGNKWHHKTQYFVNNICLNNNY